MANSTVTVKPSGQGGTYTTLNGAVSDQITNYPDLTSDCNNTGGAGILTISVEGDWTSASDTTTVDIDGFTTSSSYYVNIVTAGSAKHAGKYDTTKYQIADGNDYAIILDDPYTRVTGLQVIQTATGDSDEGFRIEAGGDNCKIRNCIIMATTSGSANQDGIYSHNFSLTSVEVENCAIYNWGRGGIHAQSYTGNSYTQSWYVRNCTIYNCGEDNDASSGGISIAPASTNTINMDVDNTIALNNTTYNLDFDDSGLGTENWSGDYNLSSDTSASSKFGANTVDSCVATATTDPGIGVWVIFTNITGGSEDFHLQSDAENEAEGYGASLSGLFTDDFEDDTRSDWDAGCDEIVSANAGAVTDGVKIGDAGSIPVVAGTVPPIAMYLSRRRRM